MIIGSIHTRRVQTMCNTQSNNINKTKNPASLLESGLGSTIRSNNIDDISIQAQRQRLLEALSQKPITTLEARDSLNILAPAARIFELRHDFDHNIAMVWTIDFDKSGRKHRVAKYTLLSGKWSERNSKEVNYDNNF